MSEGPPASAQVSLELGPGDVGAIIKLHGETYAREHGFDTTFEAYVAGPLAEFVLRASPRERVWLARQDGRLAGCIAIVEAEPHVAQVRWFLVAAEARGQGLGSTLLGDALTFCRDQGYGRVILWTVGALDAAARRYQDAGFRKVFERPVRAWGQDVIEERHELDLS